MCKKLTLLLTTVDQKAASRGLHVPGATVKLGVPTASRAQMSRMSSVFLLVYLIDLRKQSVASKTSRGNGVIDGMLASCASWVGLI